MREKDYVFLFIQANVRSETLPKQYQLSSSNVNTNINNISDKFYGSTAGKLEQHFLSVHYNSFYNGTVSKKYWTLLRPYYNNLLMK